MNLNIFCVTAACLVMLIFCSDLSAQTRIKFLRRRTSATVSGAIGSKGSRTFVLGAHNGQSLSGNVSSKKDCINFSSGGTSTNVMTEQGSNYLYLNNRCGGTVSFILTVSINNGID